VRVLVEDLEPCQTPITGSPSFLRHPLLIHAGQPNQTNAHALKPSEILDDFVQLQQIPVDWATIPSKPMFGADFTARGETNSGGPAIIEAALAAAPGHHRLVAGPGCAG
jgi:hypothetical protein